MERGTLTRRLVIMQLLDLRIGKRPIINSNLIQNAIKSIVKRDSQSPEVELGRRWGWIERRTRTRRDQDSIDVQAGLCPRTDGCQMDPLAVGNGLGPPRRE